jgi:hypothetical protein
VVSFLTFRRALSGLCLAIMLATPQACSGQPVFPPAAPGGPPRACSLREPSLTAGYGVVDAQVAAFCAIPPKEHRLKVTLQYAPVPPRSQPPKWEKIAGPKLTSDIPIPGRDALVEFRSIPCKAGLWQLVIGVSGVSPSNIPFTIAPPPYQKKFRKRDCERV